MEKLLLKKKNFPPFEGSAKILEIIIWNDISRTLKEIVDILEHTPPVLVIQFAEEIFDGLRI